MWNELRKNHELIEDVSIFNNLYAEDNEDLYSFYDGPLIYVIRHNWNILYVHILDYEDGEGIYFVRHTDDTELANLLNGTISLRVFIFLREEGFVVRTTKEGNLEAIRIHVDEIPEDCLPNKGIPLFI